jgi:hypothetical protein
MRIKNIFFLQYVFHKPRKQARVRVLQLSQAFAGHLPAVTIAVAICALYDRRQQQDETVKNLSMLVYRFNFY